MQNSQRTNFNNGNSASDKIKNCKIGIVTANFNEDITNNLTQNTAKYLLECGIIKDNIKNIYVAGALEIPLALQYLAKNTKYNYDAFIAIGCIIRGDTYHFEIVCNQSANGILQLSLKYNLPIINGILTVNNLEQAQQRLYKSKDFAYTCIEMILLSKSINLL